MRVGLLEDDVAIQEMLLLVLQDEGYAVTNYANAEECLTEMQVTVVEPVPIPIDLMIIDWRLTGSISGIEVIQYIRNNPRLAPLPIVLTTAATFSELGELQNLGVSLLEKPFSVDDMLALIKQLTRTSH